MVCIGLRARRPRTGAETVAAGCLAGRKAARFFPGPGPNSQKENPANLSNAMPDTKDVLPLC